jgi:ribosomal 30S subunit maturation factor RimM
MADIKHHFRAGRMNKDLDERLVPNGEYRDAQNIEIVTSEGSSVGSIQNVLGNTLKDGRNFDNSTGVITNWGSNSSSIKDLTNPKCIGYVVDPQNDKVYWFISSGSTATASIDETHATASVNDTTVDQSSTINLDGISGTVNIGDIVTGAGIVGEVKVTAISAVTNGLQVIFINNLQTISNDVVLTFVKQRTSIVLDSNSGTIKVGMVVTGKGIAGKVTVTAISSQTAITLSSGSSLENNALLTFKSQISCIAEFNSTTGEISPILVDKNNILKYSDQYPITGANVISGLLSWTDNQTEPKLIKISKFKAGSSTFNYHTQFNNSDFTEKDITVIKQSPLKAPVLTMSSTERTQSSFGVEGGTPVFIKKDFYSDGSVLTTGSRFDITFSPQGNFIKDDIIVLEHNEIDNVSEIKHSITVKILGLINSEIIATGYPDANTYSATCVIQTINLKLPDLGSVTWTATLKEKDPLFEDTFVRFAYRWKYKEGQYSTFSPFSETAFLPSEFLYESDEGHNMGMQNSLRTLSLNGFDTQPNDVELVEILVKDSVSNSIYLVDVLKNRETTYSVLSESFGAVIESNQILRPFDNVPNKAKAQEIIANRLIFANYYQGYNLLKQNTPDIDVTAEQSSSDTETTAIVATSNYGASNTLVLSASNSLIEVGMLITGEGIQTNTFVKNISGTLLTISSETEKFSDVSKDRTKYSSKSWEIYVDENTVLTFTKKKIPQKSVKSSRTYQLGTTYSDRYGRETPVFSSKKSSIKLPKSFGITKNRINVQLKNNAPDWATHYKFFVKETSSEYYNLALDKFYFAEDGNVWLSFPSSERNKVSEETYLILKKQHDNDSPVLQKARYRVLDVSNEAPDFISKKLISAGKASCSTLSINQPTVGSTFFQFNGPEASANPSFSSAFRTESEIQITTDIPTNKIPTAVANGVVSNSNTLEVDGKVNTIRVGDKITGTEISGNPLIIKITSQNDTTASLVLSTNQNISDDAVLTFVQAPSKISRKYEIINGGLSSSGNTYDVTLKDPIHESDEDVFSSDLVSDGSAISVTIYNKIIEPKDEFFGRFFVKISRDTILDENVIEAFPSAKSRFDVVKSEVINLNLSNDYSSKFTGEVDPKQDFAWGDQDFGNIKGTLGAINTHPKTGSEFFEFYFGGIDTGVYGAKEDDLNINVNSFITEITKPGALIQFSNAFGNKGEIYEIVGSSVKSEFRTNNATKRTWISGKRRLHKVFIKNHQTGEFYDDGFNSSAESSTSFGIINKISLVKKNIQVDDEKISSKNPAIFETEPKTKEGLDIYHEASNALPIIKAGMTVTGSNVGSGNSNIVSSVVDGSNIELLNNTNSTMSSGTVLTFTDQDNIYSFTATTNGDATTTKSVVLADNQVHGQVNTLDWYNCFSFGNGVESNRIRDDFNAPFIDKGPIVSTTLNEDYKEEHKTNGFIFSGIFNSISGVNELNQFLLALPITKNINPEYGTIQKIFARDSDLITFCEDKILKVLANKDALFNADGNSSLTATNRVLGQAIPYVGEYGISQNPESFASHAFRIYFADKARGAILRLSRDGLTEISAKGMTDFFGDNLPLSTTILGSYNDNKGSYNITLNNQTLSFDERVDGWTSFKSFIPENGFSLNNIYYTFKNGELYSHDSEIRNTFYNTVSPSSVKFIFNDFPESVKSFKTLNYEGSDSRKYTYGGTTSTAVVNGTISSTTALVIDGHSTEGTVVVGDIVTGTGISGTVTVTTVTDQNNIVLSSAQSISNDVTLTFTPVYGAGTTLDTLKKVELSPANIAALPEAETKGWFADSIVTDQQTGSVRFFKDKENFKFNKILGDNTTSSNLDTKEFSVQGLGFPSSISSSGDDFHTLTIAETGDSDLTNCTISSSITYSVEHNEQIGAVSNAIFTITPNTGFVISASDVSIGNLPTGITGSASIADTTTAGILGNTVTVSLDITNTFSISSDTTLTVDIAATANPIQYTVTGVFNTDEINTSTSSLYNFGYSGSGDYYVNAIVNGLSIDNTPVLHDLTGNSLISANMAIIGSGIPDNALVKTISGTALAIKDGTGADLNATIPDDTLLRFGKEIISKTFVADSGFEFKSAPTLDVLQEDKSTFSDYTSSNNFVSTTSTVLTDVSNSITVPLSAANSLIAVGMVVSGSGISSYTTVSGISGSTLTLSSTAVISANTVLSFFPASVTLKVYYVFSSNNPTEDKILLTAKAEKTFLDVADEITGMEMSTKPIGARGETRFIRVFGRAGSKFKLKRFTTDTVNGAVSGATDITLDNSNGSVLSGMRIEGGGTQPGLQVNSTTGSPTVITASANTTIADNTELTFTDFWNGKKFSAFETFSESLIQTIPSTGVYSIPVEYSGTSVFRTFNYEVESQENTALATDFNGANPTSINQTTEVTWTISPDVTLNSKVFGTVNGTTSSTTDLDIDTQSGGNIVVGDVVTGVGISGVVTVAAVADQDNLTLSTAQSLTNNVILTFTHANPLATSDQSITGISLSEPKELSKSGLVNFSFTITANDDGGNTFLSSSRNLTLEDFGYATVQRTVGVIGDGSNANVLFDESVQPFSIQAGSSSSLVSGGSLPSGTTISAKNVGGNFGVTLSHATENAILLAANNIALDDILTFSAPNGWIIEYSNISGNIATGAEPNTYTITGVLEVIKFGTESLTSSIGLTNLLTVGGTGAVASVSSNASVQLSGLYAAGSSNSGGVVTLRQPVQIGSGNGGEDGDVIFGSGTVEFRGDGNTVNGTTLSISSSARFVSPSISNIKFFDDNDTQLTGFDSLPSYVNTRVTFDFSVTCVGDVVLTDVLRVTILVRLSRSL